MPVQSIFEPFCSLFVWCLVWFKMQLLNKQDDTDKSLQHYLLQWFTRMQTKRISLWQHIFNQYRTIPLNWIVSIEFVQKMFLSSGKLDSYFSHTFRTFELCKNFVKEKRTMAIVYQISIIINSTEKALRCLFLIFATL